MSESNVKPEQVVESVQKLIDAVNALSIGSAADLADSQARAAEDLQRGARRLAQHRGEDDPRVLELRSLGEARGAAAEAMHDLRRAQEKTPDVDARHVLIHGRLVDAEGNPAAGQKVVLSAGNTGATRVTFPEADVDADGEFAVRLTEAQVKATANGGLVLTVPNPSPNVRTPLLQTQEVIAFEPRRTHYFELVLPATGTRRPGRQPIG